MPESMDIVERLRMIARQCGQMQDQASFGGEGVGVRVKDPAFLVESATEAADLIATLRAAVEQEREWCAQVADRHAEQNYAAEKKAALRLRKLMRIGDPFGHADQAEIAATECASAGQEAEAIAAAIRARTPPQSVPDDGWQDISTAPDREDGVLVCDATKPRPAVGTARFIDGRWRGYDHGYGVECLWPTPTHWRPLPQPPQSVRERG